MSRSCHHPLFHVVAEPQDGDGHDSAPLTKPEGGKRPSRCWNCEKVHLVVAYNGRASTLGRFEANLTESLFRKVEQQALSNRGMSHTPNKVEIVYHTCPAGTDNVEQISVYSALRTGIRSGPRSYFAASGILMVSEKPYGFIEVPDGVSRPYSILFGSRPNQHHHGHGQAH